MIISNLKNPFYWIHIFSGICVVISYGILFFSDLKFSNNLIVYSLLSYIVSAIMIYLIYRKQIKSTHKTYFSILTLVSTLFISGWLLIFGLIYIGPKIQSLLE